MGEPVGLVDPVSKEIASLRKSRGVPDELTLPDVVADSWKRCLADYNLLPDRVPRAEVLSHSEMRALMEEQEEFLRIAEPEVERLFLRLVDSEYLVSLASHQGAMLLFRCDYQYLGDLASSGVIPGSVWKEEAQGTNGVGTCLRVGKSVSIVGNQHYGAATQSLTCLTAPVFGRQGAIESVINVTSARNEDARMNRVVRNIVERSSRRIENGYFGRLHRRNMMLRLLDSADTADIAEEGRIALDDSGRILDGSSHVARLLGRPVDQLVGTAADQILELDTALHDIRPDTPITLTVNGKQLQAVLTVPANRIFGAHRLGGHTFAGMPRAAEPSRAAMVPLRSATLAEQDLRLDPVTSQAMDRALRLLNAGLPLIITGETGTGKTVFAKTIARRSAGDAGEVVFIDCAALDQSADIVGLFQTCLDRPKACLVLDRFDALDEAGQTALLSLLESDRQSLPNALGVVVISSTELEKLAKDGKLRSDLLHRLKGGQVSMPPLRANPDLEGTIKDLFRIECTALGRSGIALDDEARLVLLNYHWPGNLRELRNTLRHAIALVDGKAIRMDHLPDDMVDELSRKDLTARSQSEASKIEAALRYNGGNVSLTARYLGVSRATLYRKIQIQQARSEA
ncbi:MAG: sigma 54-interacting transcriptional regulator [Cypionkella sp.]|uniref:sigma-54-dependent Fis family transcriptional regulator n=1 Tax=Cypionkella sp. TaxID=2811411 RepID=UPI0027183762|nr:sigma 54-interacting transcriptional regulator [Cypionkella sp.]MDO8326929.1 sigma 54-interacting transcriptional regulator [Cypionkella sp.]